MNFKRIIFAGILTTFIGAFLGLVAVEFTKDSRGNYRYGSSIYQGLYKRDSIIIGGIVGALVGLSQEYVRELKHKREQELNGQDSDETNL